MVCHIEKKNNNIIDNKFVKYASVESCPNVCDVGTKTSQRWALVSCTALTVDYEEGRVGDVADNAGGTTADVAHVVGRGGVHG